MKFTSMKLKLSSAAALLASTPFMVTAEDLTVTFIHINDHHSHFDGHSFEMPKEAVPEGLSVEVLEGIKVHYGGAPRVAHAINDLVAQAKERGNEVFKAHAGDALTGTVFYSLFGAKLDAAFMNEVGFDAFVPGNHEFDDGDEVLHGFIDMFTNVPVTSYNILPGPDSPLLNASSIKKYMIKTFEGGQKIGICGMTPKTKTERSSFPDPGTTIQDEVEATTECVADMKLEDVNKIVVLSHFGYDQDQDKLAEIEGVDIIIGGDSHTLLGMDASDIGGPSSPYPYATIVNKVCIVQAWEYQKVVGELAVTWDADGNVLDCVGTPYLPYDETKFTVIRSDEEGGDFDLTEEGDIQIMNTLISSQANFLPVTEDQAMIDILKPYYDDVDTPTIAEALVNMCHNRGQGNTVDENCSDRPVQTKLGGGVCLLVSQGFLFKTPESDFSIQNAGGCRNGIYKGNFTTSNAYEILPFSNTLVTLNMQGSLINDVLEDAFENFLSPDMGGSTGSFPNAAGLRWEVDYTKPFGERVNNIEMNPRLESDQWEPLVMDRNFTVVTNNFISAGKDGYTSFLGVADYTDTFLNYAQSLIDYARSLEKLEDSDISEFSSQKITFANGEKADASTLDTDSGDENNHDHVKVESDTIKGVSPSAAHRSVLATVVLGVPLFIMVLAA